MKRFTIFTIINVALFLFFSGKNFCADSISTVDYTNGDSPTYLEGRVHYSANLAPLQPSPFMKLPVGSVHPKGWLGRYMELMRDGMTGNLPSLSWWLDKKGNAWLQTGGDHGWEEVPYWLRGYTDLAYILNDPEMIKEAEFWIHGIMQTQKPDGYFGPNKIEDLWPNMLVLYILQSYYEHTGDQSVLDFMTRYFRWADACPEDQFLKKYWPNQRGGDMLYSCLWLYNQTGDEQLLKTAEKIRRNTANWWGESLQNWHNVNIAQCFRTPAIWWQLTGNEKDKMATYNNFWVIRAEYGQVPGGMYGADEVARQGYVDPRQGIETCAIFEQMTSDMMLVRVTGDTSWADNCEDIAFNTAPACTLANFRGLRYLTSPNQTISDHLNHAPGIMDKNNRLEMTPQWIHRCCQHDHAHGWPYYVENLWLATPDGGLAAALYGENSVTARVADGEEVTITENTQYPFDETVSFEIHLNDSQKSGLQFPLYFRIPRWTKGATVAINDAAVNYAIQSGTWLRVDRIWNEGDRLTLSFPMEFSLRTWQVNKNAVSLDYGPLTFSLKIKINYVPTSKDYDLNNPAKWPGYDLFAASDWNYGLLNPAALDLSKLKLDKKAWPADQFPWDLDVVPYSVKLKGKKIPGWGMDENNLCAPLPFSPVPTDQPEEDLELIPMGAARLRISVFPTVE